MSIAKVRVSVVDLRGFGVGLAALLALTILTRPLRRRRDALSPERRHAARAGCVVVDVVSVTPFGGAPVAMADFSSLVDLARYLERPILNDRGSGAFAVEDGGRIYLHRPTEAPGGVEPAPQPEHRRRRRARDEEHDRRLRRKRCVHRRARRAEHVQEVRGDVLEG